MTVISALRALTIPLLFTGSACALHASVPAVPHLRAGTELMVDDVRIATKENVTRRIHPARKLANWVLEPTLPWEESRVYIYGTVNRDPVTGKFRMWYSGPGRTLYAESDDGLNWRKPELGVVTWEGRDTNIILPASNGAAVLVDAAEPDPARRYKALVAEPIKRGGFSGYYSADGIHWQRYGDDRLLAVGSEMGHLTRDPATGKYFAYIRPYPPRRFPKGENEKRLGAVVTSDDYIHWSDMRITLTPDAIDDAWVKAPPQRTEFYAMNGFAYGNSYLGLIPLFRITAIHEKAGKGQSSYDGPMEGQLIVSRDGLDWHRLAERDPVIPSGQTFDQSIMNVATEPVIVGDEVWHYYTGINTTHGGPMPPKRIGIALAKWRLDGFVSLDAGDKEGVIETTAFSVSPGTGLEINADASGGYVAVEVLDGDGRVLPGYGEQDCARLTGDRVHHPVRWKDRATLPAGKEYRLRFYLRNAALFSYSLQSSHPPAINASGSAPGATAERPASTAILPRVSGSASRTGIASPIPKTGNAAFFQKHEAYLARAKAGPIGVLFLGDSITEGWKAVPHIWEHYFGKYQPANFGVGGDQTQHVIWRLMNGELDGIAPKVVVLLIGTNNTRKYDGRRIAAANRRIVEIIREKLPDTKILLMAVFPRGPRKGPDGQPEPWQDRMAVIVDLNERLAGLDDGRNVRFLNINHVFLGNDGRIPSSIMPDQLHLSPAGYQLWADGIARPLAAMMK